MYEKFEIPVKLTTADLFIFNLWLLINKPINRRLIFACLLATFVIVYAMDPGVSYEEVFEDGRIILVPHQDKLGAVNRSFEAVFIVMLSILPLGFITSLIYSKSTAEPGNLTIGDDCVTDANLQGVGITYPWGLFISKMISNNIIFLFITKSNALIIPRRGLRSGDEWQRLVDFVNEKTKHLD